MRNNLYILVRKDLHPDYQSVQAGHAVAEWLLHVPETERTWDNGTLIYLHVEDEEELQFWCEKLDHRGLKWKGFREGWPKKHFDLPHTSFQ